MAPKRKRDGAGPDGKGPLDAADGKGPLGKPPFNTSPNQYTESVFRAVYPLMRITDEENPGDQRCPDKFAGPGAMDASALRKLMEICRPFVFDAEALHGNCLTEEQGQGLHLSLFQGLSRISKPRQIQLEKLERLRRRWLARHGQAAEEDVPGQAAEEDVPVPARDQPNEPDKHAEDLEDLVICAIGDDEKDDEEDNQDDDDDDDVLKKSSQSSNEDVKVQLAKKPDMGSGKKGSGFSDYRLVAHDNAPLRQVLLKYQRAKSEKLVAIVERKWAKGPKLIQGLYQGLKYACDEICNNFTKGHKSAVYVIVLCDDEYTYAKVELEGWVRVRQGVIDARSMKVYKEVASFLGVEKLQQRSELQEELLKAQLLHLSEYDQEKYPDGMQLVVGNVFMTTEWFLLPNVKDVAGFFTDGARKFYEGLARCTRGDKILSYTAAMVEQAAKDYEERRDKKMKYLE